MQIYLWGRISVSEEHYGYLTGSAPGSKQEPLPPGKADPAWLVRHPSEPYRPTLRGQVLVLTGKTYPPG